MKTSKLNKGYYIYFYYNNKDEIIYVGQTIELGRRWKQHKETWKKEVKKIGIREYPDKAGMDIFEHYYITKLNPKYNIARLKHGNTTINIYDKSSLEIYDVSEFQKKFVLTNTNYSRHRPIYGLENRLKAYGNNIVDVENGIIDLFDEKVLSLDLDKTIFRWKNAYLISSYSKTNYIEFKKEKTEFQTNFHIKVLQKFFNDNLTTFCRDENNNIIFKSTKWDMDYIDLYKSSNLYRINNTAFNIMGEFFCVKDDNDNIAEFGIKLYSEDVLKDYGILTCSNKGYIFDLKMYSKIKEERRKMTLYL